MKDWTWDRRAALAVSTATLLILVFSVIRGVATQGDIAAAEARLKQDITDVEARLKQDIVNIEVRLNQRISDVEDRLNQRISESEERLTAVIESLRDEVRAMNGRLDAHLDGHPPAAD